MIKSDRAREASGGYVPYALISKDPQGHGRRIVKIGLRGPLGVGDPAQEGVETPRGRR